MPLNIDPDLNELTQLGRYRIEQRLGGGAHAVVYKAEDTLLKRPVALKVLKPAWASNAEMISRFTREARAAGNLMHSHIAWVFDFGEIEGIYYLAVRYVEGPTLQELIAERGKILWQEALRYMEELGSALDYAHAKEAVHRDVKPNNIIISTTEGAVLTDFGLVKASIDVSFQTKADMVIGTPEYIPPEIWNGEDASPATDQYALACVFVEMLSGKPLFFGTRLDEIISKHLEPNSLMDTWPGDIPPGAELILRKALAANPSDRYPNLGLFVQALKEIKPLTSEEIIRRSQQILKDLPMQKILAQPPDSQAAIPEAAQASFALALGELDQLPVPTQREAAKGWKSRFRNLVKRPESPEKEAGKVVSKKFALQLMIKPVKVFHLHGDQLSIGRNPDCQIMVEDMNISRHHAELLLTPQGYQIRDLGSKNGTFVNGKLISGVSPLSPGDEVRLGSTILLIYEQE
jgi:serine/threonine protein kinase